MVVDIKLIKNIEQEFLQELKKIANKDDLEKTRIKFLGKKAKLFSIINEISLGFKKAKDKKDHLKLVQIQKDVNHIKKAMIQKLEEKTRAIAAKVIEAKMLKNKEDYSWPGVKIFQGNLHPLTLVENQINDCLKLLGFKVKQGKEVVSTEENFTKLNIGKNHPAREEQDTLYFNSELILRTHTSPVQIETMENHKEFPIKILVPGFVYRNDDDDATHSHQFSQMEGLWVGENVKMSDLKATLIYLLKDLFGQKVKTRFRPSHFPFTEPSVEVDINCLFCNFKGCKICKYTSWIEILGAGMVHPQVLRNCQIDPNKYQGFAFGLGLDRLAMLKYKIDDIRMFYTNDLRFLKQFNKEQ